MQESTHPDRQESPASAPTHPLTRRRALGLGGAAALSLALAACGGSAAERRKSADPVDDVADAPEDEAAEAITAALDEVGEDYADAEISLAAYDHAAGTAFSYHPDTWSYEASVVKIPIALSVLRQLHEGDGELGQHQKDLLTQSV